MTTLIRVFLILLCFFCSHTTFAADVAAKADTTPPSAEGALTVNDIPPLSNTHEETTSTSKPSRVTPTSTL